MLRFIEYQRYYFVNDITFQYISCYGLSKCNFSFRFQHLHFNTSHVTVYRNAGGTGGSHREISIHLMLRFIAFHRIRVVYRSRISIHLMLRFIGACGSCINSGSTFQYISCYGLSNIAAGLSGGWKNFNTSHVTVYRSLCKQEM